MRWKSQLQDGQQGRQSQDGEVMAENRVREISADLQTRGVDVTTAEILAAPLASQLERQRPDAHGPMLDGVALACSPQGEDSECAASRAGEFQEIERLMGSFSAELNKLDEVLQVLAAHLSRMRTTAGLDNQRVVH